MHIEYERTGGFAGMRVSTAIDSEKLEPQARKDLEGLVESAEFFGLPETVEGSGRGADRFLYMVTVESGGRRHTVTVGDGDVPPVLKPLVDWLSNAARKAQRGDAVN